MLQAFVIGLGTARFKLLEPKLAEIGISATFWQATRADNPEMGNYLSHAGVWKHILKSKTPSFVFEDDVAVRIDAKEFNRTYAATQTLDAVMYGYCLAPRRKPERIDAAVYKYAESSCTHAYWLTPRAARALLEYAQSYRGKMVSDAITRRGLTLVRTGMVSPPFFFQDIWRYNSALRNENVARRNVALFYEDTPWEWIIATATATFALGGLAVYTRNGDGRRKRIARAAQAGLQTP